MDFSGLMFNRIRIDKGINTRILMAIVTGFPKQFSGLVCPRNYKLSFGTQRCNEVKFSDYGAVRLECRRNPRGGLRYVPAKLSCNKHVLYAGRGPYQLSHEDDLPQKPFWLSFIKEAIWAWKALFVFLVEQPGQLKYIEWPGFQSTLRTAMLTLVLVALLIVALSSVDSVLCYVLALLLRRTP